MHIVTSLAALGAVLALAAPAATETYHGTLAQCADGQQIQLRAGQRYRISASSDSFDTVLRIYRDGSSEALAQNDDGGDGTNSRLLFAPSQSGTYRACVSAYGARGGGDYSLTVDQAAALPAPVSRPTSSESMTWQVFDGTLATGDDEDGGARFDDYLVTIPAGNRAMISLESADFDTIVKVYRGEDRGGDPVATDDDGGGALNSFLMFAPDEGGDYIVRVTAFAGGGQSPAGAYRLRVAENAIPQRQDRDDAATAESGD